jgi:hypothetical protein
MWGRRVRPRKGRTPADVKKVSERFVGTFEAILELKSTIAADRAERQ